MTYEFVPSVFDIHVKTSAFKKTLLGYGALSRWGQFDETFVCDKANGRHTLWLPVVKRPLISQNATN